MMSNGVINGWTADCKCHTDIDGKPELYCRKQVPFTKENRCEKTARLLAKLWLVKGMTIKPDDDQGRTFHVKGVSLRDPDFPRKAEEELDKEVAEIDWDAVFPIA